MKALLVAVLLVAGACAPKPRNIVIRSGQDANQGRHFVVLVRQVDEKEFFLDTYRKIAAMAFPAAKDATVLQMGMVWPGRAEKLTVTLPGDQPFAVYALFTSPGEPWKLFVTPPLAKDYEFLIEGNTITQFRPGPEAP